MPVPKKEPIHVGSTLSLEAVAEKKKHICLTFLRRAGSIFVCESFSLPSPSRRLQSRPDVCVHLRDRWIRMRVIARYASKIPMRMGRIIRIRDSDEQAVESAPELDGRTRRIAA